MPDALSMVHNHALAHYAAARPPPAAKPVSSPDDVAGASAIQSTTHVVVGMEGAMVGGMEGASSQTLEGAVGSCAAQAVCAPSCSQAHAHTHAAHTSAPHRTAVKSVKTVK